MAAINMRVRVAVMGAYMVWGVAFSAAAALPAWLVAKESPLDTRETQQWASSLSEILKSYSSSSSQQAAATAHEYCKQANLVCDSDNIRPNASFSDCQVCCFFCQYDARVSVRESELDLFFVPSTSGPHILQLGSLTSMPDLRNSISSRSFLPDSIATQLLPLLSTANMNSSSFHALLRVFGISSNSAMASAMQASLRFCTRASAGGSHSFCPTSLQSMARFATEKLHASSLTVLSSDLFSSSHDNKILSIQDANEMSDGNIVCHKLLFPFEFHWCHQLAHTKIYNVAMAQLSSGEVKHAIAACHTDTSAWPANHPALQRLGVSPGIASPVCHWIFNDSPVWVPSNQ